MSKLFHSILRVYLLGVLPIVFATVCNALGNAVIDCNTHSFSSIVGYNRPAPIKIGICALMKNEQGFLQEFIGYYQLHGISHIILIDDNSTLPYTEEIGPWLTNGFVSVLHQNNHSSVFERQRMSIVVCQKRLYDIGMEYITNVDLDEYMLPLFSSGRLVEAINEIIIANPNVTNISVNRRSFSATPHILEPVDQLVIESFFHRQKVNDRPFHQNPKRITKISGVGYSKYQSEFHIACCGVHFCGRGLVRVGNYQKCSRAKARSFVIEVDTKSLAINHYARSVECYHRKSTSQWSFGDYDLDNLFNRSVGQYFDSIIYDNYHCQLRELLVNVTRQAPFKRFGDWKLNKFNE